MRKYCLTKCAKQKLSKAKETIVMVASIMFATILLIAAIAGALAILGYIVEFLILIGWFWAPDKPFQNIFEPGIIGFSTITMLTLAFFLAKGTFMVLYKAAKSAGTAVAHRLDDNYESCTLFEECEDDRR